MLTLAVLVAGGVFILSQIARFFFGIQNTRSAVRRDARQLLKRIEAYEDQLVPWDEDELELLSLEQTNRTVRKGFNRTVSGVFHSIYHEPMIAYAFKDYYASGKRRLMVARTANHTFVFTADKENRTQVVMDGRPFGWIRDDGGFYDAKHNALLARVNKKDELSLFPIEVGGREVASLVNPKYADVRQSRALHLFEKIDADEEEAILVLSVFELVNRTQAS